LVVYSELSVITPPNNFSGWLLPPFASSIVLKRFSVVAKVNFDGSTVIDLPVGYLGILVLITLPDHSSPVQPEQWLMDDLKMLPIHSRSSFLETLGNTRLEAFDSKRTQFRSLNFNVGMLTKYAYTYCGLYDFPRHAMDPTTLQSKSRHQRGNFPIEHRIGTCHIAVVDSISKLHAQWEA